MIKIFLGLLLLVTAPVIRGEQREFNDIQLARIDAERIDAKCAAWAKCFELQQFNANMAWLGVGTAAVGSLVGIAYLLNKSNQEPVLEGPANPGMTEEQRKDLKAQVRQQYLENKRSPRTLSEYLAWIKKNTNEAILMTVCFSLSTLLVSKASSSWAMLTKKFDDLTGGQKPERFSYWANRLLDDTYHLRGSYKHLTDYTSELMGMTDDSLHQQLCIQKARNIMIDAIAFVDSFEECIAYTLESCKQADCLSELQRDQIKQSTELLRDLTNQMLERLEKSVQATVCLSADSMQADSLSKILGGLYGEFEHFVQMIGGMLYGDDYAGSQAIAA